MKYDSERQAFNELVFNVAFRLGKKQDEIHRSFENLGIKERFSEIYAEDSTLTPLEYANKLGIKVKYCLVGGDVR